MINNCKERQIINNEVELKLLKIKDEDVLKDFMNDCKTIHKRFKSGDLCYVAFINDIPKGVIWAHIGKCYVRGAGTIVNSDIRPYVYGIHVKEGVRRKGILGHLLKHVNHHLNSCNYQEVSLLVDVRNEIMNKALKAYKINKVKSVFCLSIYGNKISFSKNYKNNNIRLSLYSRNYEELYVI